MLQRRSVLTSTLLPMPEAADIYGVYAFCVSVKSFCVTECESNTRNPGHSQHNSAQTFITRCRLADKYRLRICDPSQRYRGTLGRYWYIGLIFN